MPKFRLELIYEYEADPSNYFDEVPEPLTREHLFEMAAIDSGPENISDFINYIVNTDEAEVVILPVRELEIP